MLLTNKQKPRHIAGFLFLERPVLSASRIIFLLEHVIMKYFSYLVCGEENKLFLSIRIGNK